MQFEWDSRKAVINVRKHSVGFPAATGVFADPLARIFPDPDHSEKESWKKTCAMPGAKRCAATVDLAAGYFCPRHSGAARSAEPGIHFPIVGPRSGSAAEH